MPKFSERSSSAATWAASSAATSGPPPATTTRSTSARGFFPCLILRLRLVVDEKGIKRETVRKNDPSDHGAPQVDGFNVDLVLSLGLIFNAPERNVHFRVDRSDRSVDDGTCKIKP